MSASETDVAAALTALRAGALVVFPTETLYGIGCDALNEDAVERLRAVKQRGADKGVTVVVGSPEMVDLVASEVTDAARRLIDAFWPGPLTILFPARSGLPAPLVLEGRIGARLSSHPVAARLACDLGHPVAAPSANPGGQAPAADVAAAHAYFGDAVACYIDAGPIAGAPSTLVDPGPPLRILREGALARPALERAAAGAARVSHPKH